MDFKQQMKFYADMVNTELDQMFAVPDNYQKSVYEAMRYSVMAGGKRIRPIIVLAVCDMLDGSLKDALRFGTAIECIHTYSLIHDDLPCMDNDDLRRGMPTCHKRFGETTALLAGDGLLTAAFEHLSDIKEYENVSCETVIKAIYLVAKAAGCDGMIGGQVVDIENENSSITDESMLGYMHGRKTGALIKASASVGALVGGADAEGMKYITDFADKVGLAFQIKDDILDFTGDEAVLGKPIGSDAENRKTTYVTLLGFDGALKKLNMLTRDAIQCLEVFGEKASFMRKLAEYLLERNN